MRRDQIVEDALSQLSNVSNFLFHVKQTFQNTATQLKKRMKVIFAGEPGVDQGGVTKEFFQLIARRLFNLSYGAQKFHSLFTTFEQECSKRRRVTNCGFRLKLLKALQNIAWLGRYKLYWQFNRAPQILALAAYNRVVLEVRFPLVLKYIRQGLSFRSSCIKCFKEKNLLLVS